MRSRWDKGVTSRRESSTIACGNIRVLLWFSRDKLESPVARFHHPASPFSHS